MERDNQIWALKQPRWLALLDGVHLRRRASPRARYDWVMVAVLASQKMQPDGYLAPLLRMNLTR